jgi:hypothetical protein
MLVVTGFMQVLTLAYASHASGWFLTGPWFACGAWLRVDVGCCRAT